MSTLAETVRDEMIRYLVSKAIACPKTGAILDVRTCVVINDNDGDPLAVLSPEGWAQIDQAGRAAITAHGFTVDAR